MNAEITDTPENPLDSAIVRNGEADFSESYGKGFYVVSGKADGWYLAVTADGQFQFYFEKTENGDFPLPDDFERTRERPGRTLGQLIEDVQLAQEMRSWKFAPETKEPSVIPRGESGPVNPSNVAGFLDRLEERRKTDEFRVKVAAVMDLLKEE